MRKALTWDNVLLIAEITKFVKAHVSNYLRQNIKNAHVRYLFRVRLLLSHITFFRLIAHLDVPVMPLIVLVFLFWS